MSPWTKFQIWLTDNDIKSKLDPEILKVVNIRSALLMFCYMDDITIYLNKYFNTFENANLFQKDVFVFLKKICMRKNIKRHQLSFIKYEKKDNILNKVQLRIPFLKKEEIKYFLEKIKNTEYEEQLLESFGLKKTEKKKISKKEMKKMEQQLKNENLISSVVKILTWKQWVNQF